MDGFYQPIFACWFPDSGKYQHETGEQQERWREKLFLQLPPFQTMIWQWLHSSNTSAVLLITIPSSGPFRPMSDTSYPVLLTPGASSNFVPQLCPDFVNSSSIHCPLNEILDIVKCICFCLRIYALEISVKNSLPTQRVIFQNFLLLALFCLLIYVYVLILLAFIIIWRQMSVLVSCCCYDKLLLTNDLNCRNLFSYSSEGQKAEMGFAELKSRCQWSHAPSQGSRE